MRQDWRQLLVVSMLAVGTVVSYQNCGDTSLWNQEFGANPSLIGTGIPGNPSSSSQALKVSVVPNATYSNMSMIFEFSLPSAAASDVTVDWSTVDGSAFFGEHFSLQSGSLVIPRNASSGQLVIPILKSDINDSNFSLKIDSATGAAVGGNLATAVIPGLSIVGPFLNRSQLLPTIGGPEVRVANSVEWASQRWVVFGGRTFSNSQLNGGLYNPLTQQWAPMNLQGSPFVDPATNGQPVVQPLLTSYQTATDGQKIYVFGGYKTLANFDFQYSSLGSIFDPKLNSWQPMEASGAPGPRGDHSMVWTGSKLIVFGGSYRPNGSSSFQFSSIGAMYDPVAKTWTPLNPINAPSPRMRHFAAWTGKKMIVFGGTGQEIGLNELQSANNVSLNDGALFDPSTNTWTPISASLIAPPRFKESMVWTGKDLVVAGYKDFTGDRDIVNGGINYSAKFAVFRLDVNTSSWIEIASTATLALTNTFDLQIGRTHFVNNRIVVLKETAGANSGFVLDLSSKVLSQLGTVAGAPVRVNLANRLGSASNGNSIFVFGGQNGSTFYSSPLLID